MRYHELLYVYRFSFWGQWVWAFCNLVWVFRQGCRWEIFSELAFILASQAFRRGRSGILAPFNRDRRWLAALVVARMDKGLLFSWISSCRLGSLVSFGAICQCTLCGRGAGSWEIARLGYSQNLQSKWCTNFSDTAFYWLGPRTHFSWHPSTSTLVYTHWCQD